MKLLQPFVFLVDSARSFCGRLGEALAGLAERPARRSFSGQTMMEMEKLLHAAFSNGLSGPIFPTPIPKELSVNLYGNSQVATRPPHRLRRLRTISSALLFIE